MANDLVPARKRPGAPIYMTPRDAALHPSAESYRERANILRRSLGPTISAQEPTICRAARGGPGAAAQQAPAVLRNGRLTPPLGGRAAVCSDVPVREPG